MAGGGARVPLSLTKVIPYFNTTQGPQQVYLLAKNEPSPTVGVTIFYTGSGQLKGRWEVVQPGQQPPSDFDLLSQASLPLEQRATQRRYTLLERFNMMLPPTGKITISGPKPQNIPNQIIGPYQLLFRIEATPDKEGDSDIGFGVVHNGGVAGFPLPSLRYYVASRAGINHAKVQHSSNPIKLISPRENTPIHLASLQFSWQPLANISLYQLQVFNRQGALFSALIKRHQSYYTPLDFLAEPLLANRNNRWRINALNATGQVIATSKWQSFTITPTTQEAHHE